MCVVRLSTGLIRPTEQLGRTGYAVLVSRRLINDLAKLANRFLPIDSDERVDYGLWCIKVLREHPSSIGTIEKGAELYDALGLTTHDFRPIGLHHERNTS